jgi:glycosyltransferase involved in cell wall biosynthesis
VRIAFDVSPLSHEPTGIGNYIRGSLAALAQAADGRHEIVAFAPTSPAGLRRIPEALTGIPVTTKLRLLPFAHHWRQTWSRAGWPPVERFLGPIDVLHYTDWMFPPQRAGLRSTMIHDLVPLHHREWVTRRTYSMHSAKYRDAVNCDTVFVNSEYTRDDVIRTLRLDPERVHVAAPGVDAAFGPDGGRAELGGPYVLTVATLEPRKNLQVLVDAHRLLEDRMQLVVVGGAGWGEQPALDAPGIQLLGRQSNEELGRLYRGAAVVAYPSRFEGFGIPIVEAMASGVPVVASSHPSMNEAAGTVALRAGPDDPEAWAQALLEASSRREELASLGLEHAKKFTWQRVGKTMLGAWEQTR